MTRKDEGQILELLRELMGRMEVMEARLKRLDVDSEHRLRHIEHLLRRLIEDEHQTERDILSFNVVQIENKEEGHMTSKFVAGRPSTRSVAIGASQGYAASANTGPDGSDPSLNVPLPAGIQVNWSVSDTSVATAVVRASDPSGLTVDLTRIKAGPVTLKVSAQVPSSTDPSGFITATGSVTDTVSPVGDILSFNVQALAPGS